MAQQHQFGSLPSAISRTGVVPEDDPLLFDRFDGNNSEYEIETIEEFYRVVGARKPDELDMADWVFQEVNFSSMSVVEFRQYNWTGANFWGCTFPAGIKKKEVVARGAEVFENDKGLPFKPFRAFMYRQEELIEKDAAIYEYYKTQKGIKASISQTIHDHSMMDALGDYLERKTPVGIMGGHKLSRTSVEYKKVVLLARELARKGFLVVTGGGPGAMEAANLGAYLMKRTDEDLEEALKILSVGNDKYDVEYKNVEAADKVLRRFGLPTYMPSIGVPTYKYGHEPSNRFATFQAKFFSNALREADLLDICSGGIIYTRGSAGTRQEIFQAACTDYYADDKYCFPMIFLEKNHWTECGLWNVLEKTSQGRPMADWLLCTDEPQDAIDLLVKHAQSKHLPMIHDVEKLKDAFWEARKTTRRSSEITVADAVKAFKEYLELAESGVVQIAAGTLYARNGVEPALYDGKEPSGLAKIGSTLQSMLDVCTNRSTADQEVGTALLKHEDVYWRFSPPNLGSLPLDAASI